MAVRPAARFAPAARAGTPARAGAPAPGGGDAAARRGLGRADGRPLRARVRRHPRLRRHGHQGLRALDRRGPGDGLAGAPPRRRDRAQREADPRRRGPREPRGDRGADLAHRLLLGLPLPLRARPALRRVSGGGRLPRPPGDPPRPRLRLAAAALDRGALLRDLPVALPDRRAHHARSRPGLRPRPGGAADARHVRGGGAVLALRGGSDQARRAGSAVAAAARQRPPARRDPPARLGVCGGRRRRGRDRLGRARGRAPGTRHRAGRHHHGLIRRRPGDGEHGGPWLRPRQAATPPACRACEAAAPKHHPAKPQAKPARSSCNSVVHVGDSTSEGLVSHDYLPDSARSDRLPVRTRRGHSLADGDRGRDVDRRAAARRHQRLRRRQRDRQRRLRRVLGDGAGHQRHRGRGRRAARSISTRGSIA